MAAVVKVDAGGVAVARCARIQRMVGVDNLNLGTLSIFTPALILLFGSHASIRFQCEKYQFVNFKGVGKFYGVN